MKVVKDFLIGVFDLAAMCAAFLAVIGVICVAVRIIEYILLRSI